MAWSFKGNLPAVNLVRYYLLSVNLQENIVSFLEASILAPYNFVAVTVFHVWMFGLLSITAGDNPLHENYLTFYFLNQ